MKAAPTEETAEKPGTGLGKQGTWIMNLRLLQLLLLQLSFHSVGAVLTLIQTKQTRIYIYINETIQKHSTDNTKNSKYKYTYYQNTHTLQNQLKQPQYKIHTK
jgi:hypothetical protein